VPVTKTLDSELMGEIRRSDERLRNPEIMKSEFLAGGAHIAQLLGSAEEMKAKGVYPVFEGHWASSFVLVW